MRIISLKSSGALTLLSALIASAPAFAADRVSPTGIVRISDSTQYSISEPGQLPQFISQGATSFAPSASGGHHFGHISGCRSGGCPNGQSGRGYRGCGTCRLLGSMVCPLGGCTHSPDHGWSRPAKHPVVRIPVVYRRYWPAKWYGEPGSGMPANARRFPSVYTPTDTTQLGFYYQRVPQWRPNPGMLPRRPLPSQWHAREAARRRYVGGHYGSPGTPIYTVPVQPHVTPQSTGPTNKVPPSPLNLNESAQNPAESIRN